MLNAIDASRGPGGIFAGGIDHDDPAKTVIPGARSAAWCPRSLLALLSRWALTQHARLPSCAEGQAVCADELAAAFALVESLTDTAAPMSAPMLALHEQLKGIQGRLAAAVKRGASAEEITADQGARARHAAARSARADATAVRCVMRPTMRLRNHRGAGRDRCGAPEARRRVRGRPGGGQGAGGPGRCVASRSAAQRF
jgi:hypothetical protein